MGWGTGKVSSFIELIILNECTVTDIRQQYSTGAFEDPDIIHVDDTVDPVRDLEIISAELRLKVCFTSLCFFV